MGTATYFSPEQAQGPQPDPPQRPLLAGHRDVRDGRRAPAVHRRQPRRHRLQAGARQPAAAEPDRAPTSPARTRPSSPSCSPRIRRSATSTANGLHDDLRRFRNGEPAARPRRGDRCRPAPHRRRSRPTVVHRPGVPGDGAGVAATTSAAAADRVAHRIVARSRCFKRIAAVTDGVVSARRLLRPRRPRASVASCFSRPCPATRTPDRGRGSRTTLTVGPHRSATPTSTSSRTQLPSRSRRRTRRGRPDVVHSHRSGGRHDRGRRPDGDAVLQPTPGAEVEVPNVEGRTLDEAGAHPQCGRLHGG